MLLLPVGPPPASAGARQDRAEWVSWLEPNSRRYQPDPGGIFVPGEARRPTLGGVACLRRHYEKRPEGALRAVTSGFTDYLVVGFDGAVELGFSSAAYSGADHPWFWFDGGVILRKAWQATNFTADVRRRLGLSSVPYLLLLNVKNSGGGALTGFDRAWMNDDPLRGIWRYDDMTPRCLEANLQIRRELGPEDFEEVGQGTWASPPPQMRDLAEDISSAFGFAEAVLLPPEEGRGEPGVPG